MYRLILLIIAILLTVVGGFVVGLPTMFFLWAVMCCGLVLTYLCNKTDRKSVIIIYATLYMVGAVYMLVSYMYMIAHGYDWLFAFDIGNAFHPQTQYYLDIGNYKDAFVEIWKDFDLVKRQDCGYWSYAVAFAYIANSCDVVFYLGQNISVLFLYAFVGVVLFRLLVINGIKAANAKKYTYIVAFISIVFFYSFQTLRDIHILLIYLIGLYFISNEKFSLKSITILLVLSCLCCLFRIESGLFMFIFVPIYLLYAKTNNRILSMVVVATFVVVGFYVLLKYQGTIRTIVDNNNEAYFENAGEGGGTIDFFQRIPVVGSVFSVVYNALLPIPFWSQLRVKGAAMAIYGGAAYNILAFPKATSAMFHSMVITVIVGWCLSERLRYDIKHRVGKPLKYQILAALSFLYIQSAVISKRRLMWAYIVVYIFFLLFGIRYHLNREKRF